MPENQPTAPSTSDSLELPKLDIADISAPKKIKKKIKLNITLNQIKSLFKFKKPPKKTKLLLIAIPFVFLVFLITISIHAYGVSKQMTLQATELEATGRQAIDAFKSQNLPEAESKLRAAKDQAGQISTSYQQLSYLQYVPVAKRYYQDGTHGLSALNHALEAGVLAASSITPYADVLGFQGEGSFSGGTAEERVKLIITTLEKVLPSFDQIINELTIANKELAQIESARYPEQIKDKRIRELISSTQQTAGELVAGISQFRPVLEQLPKIAGGNGERKKYLILFQNDNELRPTGGFLTAYAVIYVEDGKVTPEKSDDIYELDQKFYKKIPIPESLGKYLTTERYWNLRDMNISPDFKVSMDQFFEQYQTVRGEPDNIDGIIAVDTTVLTNLLEVLGPVSVAGYGTFSAENDPRCDCPQVVYALSEIITKPTPYLRDDRKGILGPMMQGILNKAYTASKQYWPALFTSAWESLEQRHVQMYFVDPAFQEAAEAINGAGRIIAPDDNDFLAIINTNLAGAKSNLFITYDVVQEITAPENGMITKSVEITYKNSRKADNCNLEAGKLCLNSTLKDWTRIYIPRGSELISSQGFSSDPETYEELGLTVIDGFFSLEPLGVAKIKLTYKVPYENQNVYTGQIWKQGGIDSFEMMMDVNGEQSKMTVIKDVVYSVEF